MRYEINKWIGFQNLFRTLASENSVRKAVKEANRIIRERKDGRYWYHIWDTQEKKVIWEKMQ